MRKTGGGGGGGKHKQPDAIDEVEELLRAAQDDVLLKLNLNSHIKSKSNSKSKFNFESQPESSHSNAIDPDLDRRFQALISKPPKTNAKPTAGVATDLEDVDNLFARFAALKAPSNSSSEQQGKVVKDDNCGIVDVEDGDEEDEVSKIINWAIDAARLDPSPSSDIDDVSDKDEDNDDDDDDSDDDDDHAVNRRKKGSKK